MRNVEKVKGEVNENNEKCENEKTNNIGKGEKWKVKKIWRKWES